MPPTPSVDLIAIDLDGTLLTSEKRVHAASAEAIHEAIATGVTICLASGRLPLSIREFQQEIGFKGPIIGNNGAIVEAPDRTLIAEHRLPRSVVETVLAMEPDVPADFTYYSWNELYRVSRSDVSDQLSDAARHTRARVLPRGEILDRTIHKVLIVADAREIAGLRQRLEASLGGADYSFTESEPEFLEILPRQVHKGSALTELAAHLGVPLSRVAAIGDYLNDLEMLQTVGISGCPQRAHPAIKQVAKVQVPNANEGGVGVFIRHLLT